MFKRFAVILTAALAVSSGATAQNSQWSYLVQGDLLPLQPEDYPFAHVCVPSDWTPANSGLAALAKQLTTKSFPVFAELKQAMSNKACDITALPAEALRTRPEILALTQSLGLVDISGDIVSASEGAAQMPDAPLSQAVINIANGVFLSCTGNVLHNSFIDCTCLANLALDGLKDGTFAAPNNGAAAEAAKITNALIGREIPAACINDAGITAQIDRQVEMRLSRPTSATDKAVADPVGYRACVVSEGLSRFRTNPTLVGLNRSGNFLSQALLACEKR